MPCISIYKCNSIPGFPILIRKFLYRGLIKQIKRGKIQGQKNNECA